MKALRAWELSPSLVRLILPISLLSIGGMSKLIVQIPRNYAILMGCFIKVQVKTTSISLRYIIISRKGVTATRSILVI